MRGLGAVEVVRGEMRDHDRQLASRHAVPLLQARVERRLLAEQLGRVDAPPRPEEQRDGLLVRLNARAQLADVLLLLDDRARTNH